MRVGFAIEPLEGITFGAWVRNLDVRDLDADSFAELHDVWMTYGLLLFADQHLSRAEQNDFARWFGELEFKAAPISNVGRDGTLHQADDDDLVKSLRGNQEWHLDSTYMPIQARGAVFAAEVVPEGGGDTAWADMRAAYQALDDADRELIADLEAHHSLYYSMGRAGLLPTPRDDGSYAMYGYHDKDVSRRPLVKVHPVTGRTTLNIGRHAHDVVGMDPAESEALLDRLNAAAAQPPRVYQHRWKAGEVVLWDNRCLMHRGVPWNMSEPRIMWHTRIAGDPTSEVALNHR